MFGFLVVTCCWIVGLNWFFLFPRFLAVGLMFSIVVGLDCLFRELVGVWDWVDCIAVVCLDVWFVLC